MRNDGDYALLRLYSASKQPATFDIEIQPGDSCKWRQQRNEFSVLGFGSNPATEDVLTSELIGDGFGEPLFYLKDSRFLPEELEMAEDNAVHD